MAEIPVKPDGEASKSRPWVIWLIVAIVLIVLFFVFYNRSNASERTAASNGQFHHNVAPVAIYPLTAPHRQLAA